MSESSDEVELKPCPFCGGSETIFHPMEYWTGQRSILTSMSIRHWCAQQDPRSSYIEIKALTKEEAIKAWNKRT